MLADTSVLGQGGIVLTAESRAQRLDQGVAKWALRVSWPCCELIFAEWKCARCCQILKFFKRKWNVRVFFEMSWFKKILANNLKVHIPHSAGQKTGLLQLLCSGLLPLTRRDCSWNVAGLQPKFLWEGCKGNLVHFWKMNSPGFPCALRNHR